MRGEFGPRNTVRGSPKPPRIGWAWSNGLTGQRYGPVHPVVGGDRARLRVHDESGGDDGEDREDDCDERASRLRIFLGGHGATVEPAPNRAVTAG